MHAGASPWRSGRRRWLLTAVLAAALVALAIPALEPAAGRRLRPAPALPRSALSGPAVTLASLRGRTVVVNFWASWCGPCAREAPALERFARAPTAGAALVGVDLNDTRSGAARFIRRFALSYPILSAHGGSLAASYGFVGLPTTVVVDPDGRIAATLSGEQTLAALRAAVGAAAHAS
jgi:cytochrome c biogenesis protein CcmG/thiol:disulfide interchange protein DsbE